MNRTPRDPVRLLRRGGGYTDQRHLAIDGTEEVNAEVLDGYADNAHRQQEEQEQAFEQQLAVKVAAIADELAAIKSEIAAQHYPNRMAHLREVKNAARSLVKLHTSPTDTPIH